MKGGFSESIKNRAISFTFSKSIKPVFKGSKRKEERKYNYGKKNYYILLLFLYVGKPHNSTRVSSYFKY